MSSPLDKRWIVIIDRAPKGPLSEEEVQTLITAKILRMNSIACRAPEEGGEKETEWKFLWQFPEFERRSAKPHAVPGSTQDKRLPHNPVQGLSAIEDKLRDIDPDKLPEELKEMSMPDLVPTVRRSTRPMGETSQEGETPNLPSDTDLQGATKAWFAGAVILFIGGAFFLKSLMSNSPLLHQQPQAKAVNRRPQPPRAPSSRTTLLNSPPKRAQISAPSEAEEDSVPRARAHEPQEETRDSGRIDEDDNFTEPTEEQAEEALNRASKVQQKRARESARDAAGMPDEVPDSGEAPEPKASKSDADETESQRPPEPEPED